MSSGPESGRMPGSWDTQLIVSQPPRQKAQMGRGFTIIHIYGNDLKSLAIAIPPVPEQTAIVRFLDDATSRIDRYIRAKRKLIDLLGGAEAGDHRRGGHGPDRRPYWPSLTRHLQGLLALSGLAMCQHIGRLGNSGAWVGSSRATAERSCRRNRMKALPVFDMGICTRTTVPIFARAVHLSIPVMAATTYTPIPSTTEMSCSLDRVRLSTKSAHQQ